MNTLRRLTTLIGICILLVPGASAQPTTPVFEVPATNSRAIVQQRVAATDIAVRYNRPSVKGRKIFGDLVPYGHVWRTGSDEATNISFSTPVTINGFIGMQSTG